MNVVPLLIQFWVKFWCMLGSILGPKSIPKLVKQINVSGQLLEPFFWVLKAIQVPLESLLERLMLVLKAPDTRKVLFSYRKITFFENVVFRYFEALDVVSWPVLTPKRFSKSNPNGTKNQKKKCSKNWIELYVYQCSSKFWSHFGVIKPAAEIIPGLQEAQEASRTT